MKISPFMKYTICKTAFRSTVFVITLILMQFAALRSQGQTSTLVISQLYGGGGLTSASYQNDFIELFNPTTSTITITNWSVQQAASTGSSWTVTTIPSATILPGHYYLISCASGGAVGSALPTPDLTGSLINMAAATGKVALVSNTTALTGTNPSASAGVVDFVGFGTGTNGFETAIIAPGPGNNVNAVIRNSAGCTDNNNNSTDFTVAAANPRNSATTANTCAVTNYYWSGSGALNTLSNWGTTTSGTGTPPTNFTTSGQAFNIRNGGTPSLTAAWTVNGGGAKIVVENTDFTIPSGFSVTGKIDVNAGRTLTITNATVPTLGTLNTTGTVLVNNGATTTLTNYTGSYGNVTFDAATPVNLQPTSGTTTTITGNLTVASGYTSTLTTGANNVVLGGNYSWVPSTGALVATNTTLTFNGSAAQSYSTNIAAANHIFSVVTLNNSALAPTGVTINNKLQTGAFAWTAGTLLAGAGTSTTVGGTFSVTGVFSGSPAKTFLGGGTWNGTSGVNGGLLRITGTGATATGGITIGSSSSTYSSGILDLASATAWSNTAGNNITVNPFSQLFITTAQTTTLSAITLTLNGVGNNATGYGVGALRNGVTATIGSAISLASDATIYSGAALTLTGIISGSGKLVKDGAALALTLTGANTNSGGALVNAGTITVNAGSSIGTGDLTLSQKGSGVAAAVAFNNSQTIGNLSSSFDAGFAVAAAQTMTVASGQTITITQSSNQTFGNGVNNTQQSKLANSGTIVKAGSADLTLTSGNYATGGTFIINAGNLVLAPSSATTLSIGATGITINGGALKITPASGVTTLTLGPVTMNGGGISTSGIVATPIITSSALTLTAAATITLSSTVAHSIKFTTGAGFSGTNTLTVRGWQGGFDGTSGTFGKVFIGTTSSYLGTNLNNISFIDGSGNVYPAIQLSNGEIVPKVSITLTTLTPGGPFYNNVNNTVSVAYTYTGPLSGTVTAQLSDGTGTFTTTATTIGTATATAGTISCTIPSVTTSVGAYKIRILATSPIALTSNSSSSFNVFGVAPVISSVSAYTGVLAGAPITISGNNFNITPSNTLVYFGAASATPTSASTGSLTVNVPVGASVDDITVVDKTTHLAANSKYAFIPSFVGDYFAPNVFSFQSDVTFAASNNPWNTAFGDLDGDGLADMAIVSGEYVGASANGFVKVYKNMSSGNGSKDFSNSGTPTFQLAGTFTVQGAATNLKIADLDGDGLPDIIVAGGGGANSISLLHNITTSYGSVTPSPGTINFDAFKPIALSTAYSPKVLTVADFDGDGKLDIAAACYGIAGGVGITGSVSDNLVVLRNVSTPPGVAFSTSGSFSVTVIPAGSNSGVNGTLNGTTGSSICAGDFNGDGKLDLAMIDQFYNANSKISLFNNTSVTGTVSFTLVDSLVAGTNATDIAAGDMDNDGHTDLVIANQYGNSIYVYHKHPDATFNFDAATSLAATMSPHTSAPGALALADMDADGKLDVLFTNSNPGSVGVYEFGVIRNTNTSSGVLSFASTANYTSTSAGSIPAGVIVADIDHDSYPDVIVSNYLANTVSVFRNKPTLNMGIVSGVDTICSGSSSTLSYSAASLTSPKGVTPAYATSPLPSSLSYKWSTADTLVATIDSATGFVTAVGADTVRISYALSLNGTNIVGSTSKVVYANKVDIIPAGDPDVCLGVTSYNLGYTIGSGVPTTYSLVYDDSAHAHGFVDVVNAVLPVDTITLVIPPTAIEYSYTASLTVSGGGCVSTPRTITINIHSAPAASIVTTNATPCAGHSSEVVMSGAFFSTITYSVDGGAATPYTFSSGTTDTIFLSNITVSHTYVLIGTVGTYCNATLNDTVTIVPSPMQWVGGVVGFENDWNTAANWSCGQVPGDTDIVTIPATLHDPSIAASVNAHTSDITIANGVTLSIGSAANLYVKGALNNSGDVVGNGSLVLNGTSAQTISGTSNINNLELNNTSGATIGSGSKVVIKSALTLTAGNFATGDSLTLYSDSNGSARIAEIQAAASISGKVKVTQFIQANYRRYRFWSHPFNAAMSLGQLETCLDITGSGGAVNGFTSTSSNAPSAFRLDPLMSDNTASYDPGWRPITKINGTEADSNKLNKYQGLRLFMRGAKGQGLDGLSYTPSSNTLSMTGVVNQGNQTVTLQKGSANQTLNMVGNPYPSPVDLGTVLYNAANASNITGTGFYVYNSGLGAAGQYQLILFGSGSPASYVLPANASFQVRAAFNGATLNFTESMKAQSPTTYLFKDAFKDYVSLYVYDANYHPWDMLYVKFNEAASDVEDLKYDAIKPAGAEFNFYSLSADNKKLVADARPFVAEKIIPLGISSPYKQEFIIKAENIAVPANGTIFLHDKLLNKYVELLAGTEYRFSITADKATQGENRFELSMKLSEVVSATNLQVEMTPNPAVDNVTVSFTSGKKDNVSIRVMDMSGVTVYTQNLGTKQKGSVVVPMTSLASGIYMVELTSGDQKSVQRLVKE